MATPASRLIQDQNLDIHSTGARLGGKIDASRTNNKGALGGRRALNDISNSGKPSSLQQSTKHNPVNVVSTAKTSGVSKSKFSRATENVGKATGRKALSDLTNSAAKQFVPPHLSKKKSQDKKLSIIEGENTPSAIKEEEEEEAFLHNHQECKKAQRNIISFDHFLDTVGLNNGSSLVLPESSGLKAESPIQHRLEMKEMPMMQNDDDKVAECWEAEFSVFSSPPVSVKPADEIWKDESLLGFTLIETPKLQKKEALKLYIVHGYN